MSQTLRKRCREAGAMPDYIDVQDPKRAHGEETEQFLQLRQLGQTLADDEKQCALSEELVDGVMRSVEEEIATPCCTSHPAFNSTENSAASDMPSSHEDQIPDNNLCYLLEASDDELGIPPSPGLVLKDEACLSPKETSDGLRDNRNLKSLGANWHFDDDFENNQQFALHENLWDPLQLEDYLHKDFVGESILYDGDFPTAWELETCTGM